MYVRKKIEGSFFVFANNEFVSKPQGKYFKK